MLLSKILQILSMFYSNFFQIRKCCIVSAMNINYARLPPVGLIVILFSKLFVRLTCRFMISYCCYDFTFNRASDFFCCSSPRTFEYCYLQGHCYFSNQWFIKILFPFHLFKSDNSRRLHFVKFTRQTVASRFYSTSFTVVLAPPDRNSAGKTRFWQWYRNDE